ncbi:MAG TPA: hypothetical protein VGL23_12915, partial [Chloroflexota bacterium]
MVDQAAQFVTQVVFVLIAVLTAAEFARERGPRSRDAALMFAALAGIIAIQWFTSVTTVQSRWLTVAGSVMILAQPYLLIRLVRHVRAVPSAFARLALAGMVVSWAIVIAQPPPLPLAPTLVVLIYFAAAELYAGAALVRGALAERGQARRRLTYAAAGSCLLAALI